MSEQSTKKLGGPNTCEGKAKIKFNARKHGILSDIITEYELIQKKHSKLTKSKRDWVISQFERNFERVS